MKADRRDNNSLQNSGLKRREPPYAAPIGNSFDYFHLLLLIFLFFFLNVIFDSVTWNLGLSVYSSNLIKKILLNLKHKHSRMTIEFNTNVYT